jgi:hypothetical protein
VNKSGEIVRYWQWPVVVFMNKIVLRDSDPEGEFVVGGMLNGEEVYKVRSIEFANQLIHRIAPRAGPLLSRCDYLTWNRKIIRIIEVVKCDENKKAYWKGLLNKEDQKGGYYDLAKHRKLRYERVDLRSWLPLFRSA